MKGNMRYNGQGHSLLKDPSKGTRNLDYVMIGYIWYAVNVEMGDLRMTRLRNPMGNNPAGCSPEGMIAFGEPQ